MFRKIEDFLKVWHEESGSTLRILRALTDESLAQKVTENGRSLGFLAQHVTTSVAGMFKEAGLKIEGATTEAEIPESVAEIISQYELATKSAAEELPKHWTDEQLEDEIPMYGGKWKKGVTLMIMISHQTHHRAQMTVLMRQAGLKVPGVYGPAREEWETYGMAAMA